MKKQLLLLAAGLMMGTAAADAATVYFQNTGNWSSVYVWSWGGTNPVDNGINKWPGIQITETVMYDGVKYYKYESTAASIIFTTKTGSPQTKGDLVVDNMIYDANGATGRLFGGGTVEIPVEVYLAGNFNGWNSSDAAYKFTKVSATEYTYEIGSMAADAEFKIVNTGAWYGYSYSQSTIASGVEYDLYDSLENCKLDGAAKNIKFVYNPEANVLKVTYTLDNGTVDPTPNPGTGYAGWYLNVIGNNGNLVDGVELNADGTATVKNVPVGTGTFEIKIWDGNADAYYSNGGEVALGEWTVLPVSGGVQMTVAGASSDSVYDIAWNEATKSVYVTLVGGTIDPVDPNPGTGYTGWYLNVIGNNGNLADGVEFNEDGTATVKNVPVGTGTFEIKIWNGSADAYYSNGGEVALGEWTVLPVSGGVQMTVAGASSDSVYDIAWNEATKSVYVTLVGGTIDPVDPNPGNEYAGWYLNVIGNNGNIVDGVELNADGTATAMNVPVGTGTFEIKIWNGSADLYYSNGGEVALGEWTVLPESQAVQMTVAGATPDSVYDITWDEATKSVRVVATGTSGVAAVETAEAPVYFNLQGVQVANPANGLYIKVEGGKTTKVLVK